MERKMAAFTFNMQAPISGSKILIGAPITVSGTVTGKGGAEPDPVESVTVQLNDLAPVTPTHKVIPHQPAPTWSFAVTLPGVTSIGPVSIVLRAAFNSALPISKTLTLDATIWTLAGAMAAARSSYTATALPDGKVLFHGGWDPNLNGLNTSELYDPVTQTSVLTGSSRSPRAEHSAVYLPTIGKVLVVDGASRVGIIPIPPCELFDPATGTWIPTDNVTNQAQQGQGLTLLADDRAMVVGGLGTTNTDPIFDTAEIFTPDPATGSGSWSPTKTKLNIGRYGCTATLLADGRVLVVGGSGGGGAFEAAITPELFDPQTEFWTKAENLNFPRLGEHTATLLRDGTVLVTGGYQPVPEIVLDTCEIYDPVAGHWHKVGDLNVPRAGDGAVLLPDGQVLVAGGDPGGTSELYNPSTGQWTLAGDLNTPRMGPTETLVVRRPQGRFGQAVFEVVVAGGSPPGEGLVYLTSIELYSQGTVLVNPFPVA